jgi:ribosomal protein S18 acetylase RimI-like enzyme
MAGYADRPGDLVLVAERPDVVGFIAVWCRSDPYINNLHVPPGGRSKGVGRRLMVAAAERLIGREHATAFLRVFEKNRRAVRFYERLGGEVREREVKPVFGHAMPSVKVVWSDLSVIIGHERGWGMFCHAEVPGQ